MSCSVVKDRKRAPFKHGELGQKPQIRHVPLPVQKDLSVGRCHTGSGRVQGAWAYRAVEIKRSLWF